MRSSAVATGLAFAGGVTSGVTSVVGEEAGVPSPLPASQAATSRRASAQKHTVIGTRRIDMLGSKSRT